MIARKDREWLATAANTPMQLHSRWSFRPSVNGFANVLACYKGYSVIQVPHTLHLTYRIAPFRNGSNIVKTTSALGGPLFAISSSCERIGILKKRLFRKKNMKKVMRNMTNVYESENHHSLITMK
jgi:hypothetical protein